MNLTDAINSLPAPPCPEDLGAACPGPSQAVDPVTGKPLGNPVEPCERVASESRPGELDVTVRCKSCQARVHYTLDSQTGQVLDAAALVELRRGESPKSQVPSPKSAESGLNMSPAAEAPALPPSGNSADHEPEHDLHA